MVPRVLQAGRAGRRQPRLFASNRTGTPARSSRLQSSGHQKRVSRTSVERIRKLINLQHYGGCRASNRHDLSSMLLASGAACSDSSTSERSVSPSRSLSTFQGGGGWKARRPEQCVGWIEVGVAQLKVPQNAVAPVLDGRIRHTQCPLCLRQSSLIEHRSLIGKRSRAFLRRTLAAQEGNRCERPHG